jgi:hypothetical protein
MSISIVRVEAEGVSAQIKEFIHHHPNSNWFTSNALIPGPLKSGNSVFILVVVSDDLGIAGVAVGNLYFQELPDGQSLKPFRLQINGAPMIRTGSSDREEILSALLSELAAFADQNAEVTEFRNFPVPPNEIAVYEQFGFRFESHLNLIKPLSTLEEAWRSLSKCRRRQIRKATENGTQVRPAANMEEVRKFYNILENLYLNRIQKKLPPDSAFTDFYVRAGRNGDGAILVVLAGEEVIGGMVCLIEPGKSLTEWYICGLDHEWRHHYPSVMATWGGITLACQLELPEFNFLGLGKPEIPYGVRDFKLRFGGNTENYGRLVRMNNQSKPPLR